MHAGFFRTSPARSPADERQSWSKWIRQIHRWLAIAFTVGVIANFAVYGQEPYPLWAGVMALLPLALLLLTGLYMFMLPYAIKWSRAEDMGRGHE